jgi:chromate transporter
MREAEAVPSSPSFREALRFWWRLGWISFGGPTGQIAIMHEEVVDRRKWIDEESFLHALNFCMMLPGPEAQQLATYLGWRLHGTRGALCAGLLFILPAVFILWALSLIYVLFGTVPIVAAAFYGLIPAIIAIVVRALFQLGKRTLRHWLYWVIALGAAVAMTHYRASYPLIVLGAGLLGALLRSPPKAPPHVEIPALRLWPQLRIGALCLLAWWTPVVASVIFLGRHSTVTREAFFFSKAALVTFGGAYALLPYVAQQAVEQFHWLAPDQMLHGFALAETTPGPLVMVLQFVGFLGAWNQPGSLPPLAAATLGSLLTTWVTFSPSFLFILVGAPFVDRLTRIPALQAALKAVSAAVVGVMASFALWFGSRALFPHPQAPPDLFVLLVGLGALLALCLTRLRVMSLLGICAGLGILVCVL